MDSDWAGDTDTHRSHTEYIIMMNGGPISWKSRHQDSVVLSTSETEYIVASEVGKEILYFAPFFAMWVTHKLHRITYMRII